MRMTQFFLPDLGGGTEEDGNRERLSIGKFSVRKIHELLLCDYPCKACGVERLLTEADRIRQLYGLSSRWLDGEWTHNGQDDGCPLAERPVESVEEKEVVEKEAVIYVLEGKKVTGEVYKKPKGYANEPRFRTGNG